MCGLVKKHEYFATGLVVVSVLMAIAVCRLTALSYNVSSNMTGSLTGLIRGQYWAITG